MPLFIKRDNVHKHAVKIVNVLFRCIYTQEDQNRGKPNWEHLSDDLHVLLTVEDTENRAQIKLARAVEEVKKLLVPVRVFILNLPRKKKS